MPDETQKRTYPKLNLRVVILSIALVGLIIILFMFGITKKGGQITSQKVPAVTEEAKIGPEPTKVEVPITAESAPQELTTTKDPCDAAKVGIQELLKFIAQKQQYKKIYGDKNPSEFINATIDRLSSKLPYVGDDPTLSYMSQFHLFRALGLKDVGLIKAILEEDPASTEVIFKDLYVWISTEGCEIAGLKKPKKETIIAYTRFFLESESGLKYLERRSKSLNFLIRYYLLLLSEKLKIALPKDAFSKHYNFCKGYLDEKGQELYFREDYLRELPQIKEKIR